MKNYFNKEFDLDGSLSTQGRIKFPQIISLIDLYLKKMQIYFDTTDFSISEFRGLNKFDGLKTLTLLQLN